MFKKLHCNFSKKYPNIDSNLRAIYNVYMTSFGIILQFY